MKAANEACGTTLDEVIRSEECYVHALEVLAANVVTPLRALLGTPEEVLSPAQCAALFGPLPDVLEAERRCVASPLARAREAAAGVAAVAGILADLPPAFVQPYATYVRAYPATRELLAALHRRCARWHAFTLDRWQEGATEGYLVEELLLLPIQRLCQYPGMLADVLGCFPQGSVEYQRVSHAAEAVRGKLAELQGELQYIMEELAPVDVACWALIHEVEALPPQPHRRLAHEGWLYFECPKSTRRKVYVHVFSDCLTIAYPMRCRFLVVETLWHASTTYSTTVGDDCGLVAERHVPTAEAVRLKLFAANAAAAHRWRRVIGDAREAWLRDGPEADRLAALRAEELVPDGEVGAEELAASPRPEVLKAVAVAVPPGSKAGTLTCRVERPTRLGRRLLCLGAGRWKSRYVVVRDHALKVYDSEGGEEVATFSLDQSEVAQTAVKAAEVHHHHAFSVKCSGDTGYFCPLPDTPDSLQEWLAALQPPTMAGVSVDVAAVEALQRRSDRLVEELWTGLEALRGAGGAAHPCLGEAAAPAGPALPARDADQQRRVAELLDRLDALREEQDRGWADFRRVATELSLLAGGGKAAGVRSGNARAVEERLAQALHENRLLQERSRQRLARFQRRSWAFSQVLADADAKSSAHDPLRRWNHRQWPNYDKHDDGVDDLAVQLQEELGRLQRDNARLQAVAESLAKEGQQLRQQLSAVPTDLAALWEGWAELYAGLREETAACRLTECFVRRNAAATADGPDRGSRSRPDAWQGREADLRQLAARWAAHGFPTGHPPALDEAWAALAQAEAALDAARAEAEASRQSQERRATRCVAEADRVLDWCQAQKANLLALQEPEGVAEFVASLHDASADMQRSLDALAVHAQPLATRAEVQSKLVQVRESWLGLHVDAYDRLQRTILEVHATHPLADEMRRYGPYSLQVQAFLEVVRDTLLTAGETLGSAVQPLLGQCQALLCDWPVHHLLAGHLADLACRLACLADGYRVLRTAVLSPLTTRTSCMTSIVPTRH